MKQKIDFTETACKLLANSPGIKLITGKFPYPTPVLDAAGNDLVYVGRCEDISPKRIKSVDRGR